MKRIKYYCFDENSDLKEISKDDEIVKTYNSAGIEVAFSHGYESHQLLKLTILPVDIKIAPLKELPTNYAEKRKQQKQEWEESRKWIQRIIDESKENKGPDQEKLLRLNPSSQGYFTEYDRKNDPRNRVDISKGILNKRKRGKKSPPQD